MREFSKVGSENITYTANPVAMIGLSIASANNWLAKRGIKPPTNAAVADKLGVNRGNWGQMLRGEREPPNKVKKWINHGKRALCFYFFGCACDDAQANAVPPGAHPLREVAWRRILDVLFWPDGQVPRFFRGRRIAWASPWSQWELLKEFERLAIHCKYSDAPVLLIFASGHQSFPVTDARWSPNGAGSDLRNHAHSILQHGGKVRFAFKPGCGSQAETSWQDFRDKATAASLPPDKLGLVTNTQEIENFLHPVLQFAYLSIGESRSLLVLRGLGQSDTGDRGPISILANQAELKSFEESFGISPRAVTVPTVPPLPNTPHLGEDRNLG
ncbi:MAG: hypothetical protein AAF802_15225 [Planctomycetota bacterium]